MKTRTCTPPGLPPLNTFEAKVLAHLDDLVIMCTDARDAWRRGSPAAAAAALETAAGHVRPLVRLLLIAARGAS